MCRRCSPLTWLCRRARACSKALEWPPPPDGTRAHVNRGDSIEEAYRAGGELGLRGTGGRSCVEPAA